MRTLPWLGLLLALGCTPTTLQMPPTTPETLSDPRGAREITTLLDLDVINDAEAGGGYVYAATERGLLIFDADGEATRLMETDRFTAVAASPDGRAVAASRTGLLALRGAIPAEDTPPVLPEGEVRDLLRKADGTLWACGSQGVLTVREGAWVRIGEPAFCTALFEAPGGGLWAALDRGLLFIDAQDVVREHRESRGLPAGFVRSVVPVGGEGEAYALVQSPSDAYLAHYDGSRWFSYTIDGFERKAVGLARRAGDILLFSEDYAFRISDPVGAGGVRLTPLQRGERDQVLGYRAEPTEPTAADTGTPTERSPVRLAPVPPNHPTIDAPALVVEPADALAGPAYLVRSNNNQVLVAMRNQGILVAGEGEPRTVSSRNLVASRDLQIASDERGMAWLVTDDGTVGVWQDGALQTVPAPEGTRPWSIAPGPRGVYLASTVPSRPNVVQVHRRMPGDQWLLVVEQSLFGGASAPTDAPVADPEAGVDPEAGIDPEAGADPEAAAAPLAAPSGPELLGVPMLGVTEDETIWVGVRVAADTESGGRMRGVAVFSANGDGVTYHHQGSDRAVDGDDSQRMPDDFDAMDVNEAGMAWFATLVGAIRIGNHQSVYFGEDRGVRGEVVSDVLVGGRGRMWVAAAEGPGYRQQGSFEFRMPSFVKEARPLRLALDPQGRVWAAGPNGLLVADGDQWTAFGEAEGLPTTQLLDVEADPNGNLWLLTPERVLRLSKPVPAPTQR